MKLRNSTELDSKRIESIFLAAVAGWPTAGLDVRIRYSRGADFSGSCYYDSDRIFINLGRRNRFPYRLLTHIARPRSNRTHWWRELYSLELADAYQLALFVFLHEFYHRLVKLSRRNVRQKEARCDRFAARFLVDHCGAAVRDSRGRCVPREEWDFQDLESFVAAARRSRPAARRPLPNAAAARPPLTGREAGASQLNEGPTPSAPIRPWTQLHLFDLGSG